MNKIRIKIFFFIAIYLITGSLIFCSETGKITIKAAVCRFEYRNNDSSNLAYGLSAVFLETVAEVMERSVSSEEMAALMSEENKNAVAKKVLEVERLYSQRDEIILSNNTKNIQKQISENNTKLEKAVSELEKLRNDSSQIDSKPDDQIFVVLPMETISPADGLVFKRQPGNISATAEQNDLDLVIYGYIEDIDEYQLLEVRVWNNLISEDILVWKTALSTDDVNAVIEPGLIEVKTAVAGKIWAELSVNAPDNSLIYIDGNFKGISRINKFMTEPGNHIIGVRKRGLKDVEKEVILEPYRENSISIELEEIEKKTLILQTVPDNADIYLDSQWVGKSPLRVDLEDESSVIMVKKEGWEQVSFLTEQDDGYIKNIILSPDVKGRNELVNDSRKRFYASFGGFMLSIPVTALLYSMGEQSSDAYYREVSTNGYANIDELNRLKSMNSAEYGLYIVSLGLNIFMLLDTIYHAVEYVGSVEY